MPGINSNIDAKAVVNDFVLRGAKYGNFAASKKNLEEKYPTKELKKINEQYSIILYKDQEGNIRATAAKGDECATIKDYTGNIPVEYITSDKNKKEKFISFMDDKNMYFIIDNYKKGKIGVVDEEDLILTLPFSRRPVRSVPQKVSVFLEK